MDELEMGVGRQGKIVVGDDISLLSVAELRVRITHLEGEIVRLKADIVAKEGSKKAAEAFFKS